MLFNKVKLLLFMFLFYNFGCGKVVSDSNYSKVYRPLLSLQIPLVSAVNMGNYPIAGSCVTEAGDVTVEVGDPVIFTATSPCVNDEFAMEAALTASAFYIDGSMNVRASQMGLRFSSVVQTDSIMITRWQLSAPDLTVTLPLRSGASYEFTVDWGDGSSQQIVTADTSPNRVHTYASAGTYDIRIIGLLSGWGTAGTSYATGGCRITEVVRLGNMNWRNLRGGFINCTMLTTFNSQRTDVSNVNTMEWMFRGASVNPNVGHWDVSKVTNMGGMFENNINATPDVRNWDVSNVTNMWSMFYRALNANPDVSLWDTSSLITATSLFDGAASAVPDVSQWNVSQVTAMDFMFRDASSADPDTRNWNVGSVTTFRQIFGINLAHTDLLTQGVSAQRYSDFLIMAANTSARTNRRIDAQQYYFPSATAARADLISRGWTINDFGLHP